MKKSFTLLEVLISITLTVFIFTAIFEILHSLKITENSFLKKVHDKHDLFVKAIYYDLLNAKNIKIIKTQNPDVDKIYLQTSNSLYGFYEPYVVWVVKKGILFRIEDKDAINLPGDYKYFDEFAKDVKIFKIYKKDDKYFLFLKDKKNIYFEFKGIK